MIASNFFQLQKNKNGFNELKNWNIGTGHGFSSVLTIKKFDSNFKPYLYLFKYMTKAQRIGKQFIYCSRGLNDFQEYPADVFDKKLYDLMYSEHKVIPKLAFHAKTSYYKRAYVQSVSNSRPKTR